MGTTTLAGIRLEAGLRTVGVMATLFIITLQIAGLVG